MMKLIADGEGLHRLLQDLNGVKPHWWTSLLWSNPSFATSLTIWTVAGRMNTFEVSLTRRQVRALGDRITLSSPYGDIVK